MHVVFVLPDAYALAIFVSEKNILEQQVKCIRCCKRDVVVDMAIFTSSEVTFERKNHAFSRLTH